MSVLRSGGPPGFALAIAPTLNFDGMSFTEILPSDLVGAAAPNHYIQTTIVLTFALVTTPRGIEQARIKVSLQERREK
jgi:hypothetical protein